MMAAVKLYDQTKLDLLISLWQLRADVRRAYTELVISIEAQRTLTELYELTERLNEVSKSAFRQGMFQNSMFSALSSRHRKLMSTGTLVASESFARDSS